MKPKNPAAVELGRKGGRAKWARITPEEKRTIIDRLAATRRAKKGRTA